MNNIRKKIFKNFCLNFEGVTPQELDFYMYSMVLSWITEPTTLKELNVELKYILQELYLIYDIKNPVEYLIY